MSKKALDTVDERDLEAARLWRAEAQEVDTDEPVEIVVRHHAHKDTKHWCRGRVGREHTLAIDIPPNAWRRECGWATAGEIWYDCHHVELCTVCGKQLRRCYGWLTNPDPKTSLRPEDCPDYRPFTP